MSWLDRSDCPSRRGARLAAALRDTHAHAVLVGALLGVLSWAMARFGDARLLATGHIGFLAVLMVAAGGAAFVCHAVDRHAGGRRVGPGLALKLSRRWVLLLCLSCLAVIEALGQLA